jgi:hypothetical protein
MGFTSSMNGIFRTIRFCCKRAEDVPHLPQLFQPFFLRKAWEPAKLLLNCADLPIGLHANVKNLWMHLILKGQKPVET